jgi:hypothetical protein|tara:strand:- start:3683 stop:4216 length:534 start_codon:yes stop_codon:yes gene_type:complete
MAKELPARGTFSTIEEQPAAFAAPGESHHDVDVEHLVKGQHYAMAYYGRDHGGQAWEGTAFSRRVLHTGNVLTRVLAYVVVPRVGMTNLRWRMRINSSHAASTMRVRVVDGGPFNTDTVIGAGTAYYVDDTSAVGPINRADLETVVEVWLQSGNAAGTVDLLAFSLWDMDLAASTLP